MLWSGDDDFAMSFGLALSRLAGPLPMTVHGFHIYLAPERNLEEVKAELDETCQRVMEVALAGLQRTQVLMDQLSQQLYSADQLSWFESQFIGSRNKRADHEPEP
ncbi:MAG: hypothetical protein HN348_07450 [Proteobacteria bacterium]|nr:hypothetical protein [Pseudomonadota bacterium]